MGAYSTDPREKIVASVKKGVPESEVACTPTLGFDASSESLEALERFFQGGEAELELVESYTSGDLVVLVVIERQHGQVGGLPDQDLSLRVTWVFRREGSEWRQVHRHADPLVHGISLEQLAALARG